MTTATASAPKLNFGSRDDFERVRQALKAASYDEETILRTLKIERMSDVGGINFNSIDFSDSTPQFCTILKLFFGQRPVSIAELEGAFDRQTLTSFKSLGLIGESASDLAYAKVLVYPVAGFTVASDRHSNPDGSEFQAPEDIVFPAIFGGTLNFLRYLPVSKAEDALDLCAGSGIGALVLSKICHNVISSDVTQRATDFAEFNRRLNDVENVAAVCGDLYSSVSGKKFDRIVAHPPYVPSLSNETIWRDGGTTGELLTKRIVEGLPDYLRPGGISCVVSLGPDTTEGPFEQRARKWLRESANDFDIIFAVTDERTPEEVLRDIGSREPLDMSKVAALRKAFDDAGVVKMPHGALVLRRRTPGETHEPWTFRTTLSSITSGADFERAFAVHYRFEQVDELREIAESRPSLASRLQVVVTHVVHEEELVPAEIMFEVDKPFEARGRVDQWMVPLFTRFNGRVTPREVFNDASANKQLPEGFKLEDFSGLVIRMIKSGYLFLSDQDLGLKT